MKKGPGRRPLPAGRQRFVELRERGRGINAAAREVGVSRSAGASWPRGYKTCRRGQVTGVMPPPERLAVREVSPRFLSQDERIETADLRQAGVSMQQVAERLGRSPSAISRELRRNASGGGYRPSEAHRQAVVRRGRSRPWRIRAGGELRHLAGELPARRWSPQQVSHHLRVRFRGQRHMRLCHESIYQAICQPGSGLLRPSPLAPRRRSPLRTGRGCRRAHHKAERRRPRFEQPVRRIGERPFPPEDRSQAGHREGGLITGKDGGSATGTLAERQTRLVRLLHMPRRGSDTLHDAPATRMADLPPDLMRTITRDQGTEMARHLTITRTPGAPVYFSDSHSPWQRGTSENTNGLPRDYSPKSTGLSTHSPAHLLAVENELSSRPRHVLSDQTPAGLLAALLAPRKSACAATLTRTCPAARRSKFECR